MRSHPFVTLRRPMAVVSNRYSTCHFTNAHELRNWRSSVPTFQRTGLILTRRNMAKFSHFNTFQGSADAQKWEQMRKMDFQEIEAFLSSQDVELQKPTTPVPQSSRKSFFKDRVRVHVKGGRGGAGGISFYRGPHQRTGPPDGGNGGDGGSVIIRAKEIEPNLSRLKHLYFATDGGTGRRDNRTGKTGSSLIIDVPVGCIITEYFPPNRRRDDEDVDEDVTEMSDDNEFTVPEDERHAQELASSTTEKQLRKLRRYMEENSDQHEFVPFTMEETEQVALKGVNDELVEAKFNELQAKETVSPSKTRKWREDLKTELEVEFASNTGHIGRSVDLDKPGNFVVAALGGRGGRGNRTFASGSNRSPKQSDKGLDGENRWYNIELKMLAHVGLVGFPNAGKSSLLSALSNARPKVAHYAFTTLTPNIGTITSVDSRHITIADLPGLIEGASDGRGLGYEFLRHIERTQVLCYVLDMAGFENRDPWSDFMILREELKSYKSELVDRRSIIVANKMDLPKSAQLVTEFKKRLLESGNSQHIPVFEVSAQERTGIEPLVNFLRTELEEVHDRREQEDRESAKHHTKKTRVLDMSDELRKYFENGSEPTESEPDFGEDELYEDDDVVEDDDDFSNFDISKIPYEIETRGKKKQ